MEKEKKVILHLKAKPGSRFNNLERAADGNLMIRIKAPALDGKANEALIAYLSIILKVPKSKIHILSGFASPFKKIEITTDNEAELMARLGKAVS